MSLKYIKSACLILLSAILLTGSVVYVEEAIAEPIKTTPAPMLVEGNFIKTTPLQIVASPKLYLNKNVLLNAKFDKFSTLGLDYNIALRSSDDYISFLIKRDDTTHDIPLSEMKLFLKRDLAEKNIDLKTNDEIQIKGYVFSDALGDPWIDVNELTITKKAPDNNDDGV